MLVSSCYEQNIFEKPTQTVKMGMDGDEKLTIHLLGLTSSLLFRHVLANHFEFCYTGRMMFDLSSGPEIATTGKYLVSHLPPAQTSR